MLSTPEGAERALAYRSIEANVGGVAVEVSALHRLGSRMPIVCLHGFGSTKEDYADLAGHPEFADNSFLAYDAPGCGQTYCEDLSAIDIPFLAETAETLVDSVGFERFHLIGHSMGGLTALKLAKALGERVVSFTNIEGNVSPEDCFLSRQIVNYPAENPKAFFDGFAERMRQSQATSSALYAATLPHRVRAEAVAPIFHSMVRLSDSHPLLDEFCGLSAARMFVYGAENRSLSYLPDLQRRGVQLAEIPHSGHFPMYSNPSALWTRIASFIELSEPAADIQRNKS